MSVNKVVAALIVVDESQADYPAPRVVEEILRGWPEIVTYEITDSIATEEE